MDTIATALNWLSGSRYWELIVMLALVANRWKWLRSHPRLKSPSWF